MRYPLHRARLFLAFAAIFAGATAAPATAVADTYPSHPVTLVSPFAAGGTSDLVARTIAQPMSEVLGQQVVVVNKTGAGGTIGVSSAAAAPADGYTIVLGGLGSIVFPAGVYKGKIRYDAQRDLVPVGEVGTTPVVIVTRADLPYKDLKELVAFAKAHPDKLSYGSAGVGGTMHMTGVLLEKEAGVRMTHVPYRGSGPAITDLLGGQLDLTFAELNVITPHLQSGKLRALAIASPKRNPAIPAVPTTAEQGFGKVQMETWYALFAPKNVKPEVMKQLRQALDKARTAPKTLGTFEAQQITPAVSTDAQFSERLKKDFEVWLPMIAEVCGSTGCE
ncbi:MAG TPA: tripartite tricarboxylate transporter substrate binding protein [Noviherbaspirillum sp.]|nr:tripartite tricarboxylate transporter substrate binding protein [Noviherbaspirillum sp.]